MIRLAGPFVVAVCWLTGCSEQDRVCSPGATQVCICTNGREGAQSCNADGAAWGACSCESAKDAGTPDLLTPAGEKPVSRDLPAADRLKPDSPGCGAALNAPCCAGNTCLVGFKCWTMGLSPTCKILTGYTGCTKPGDCLPVGPGTSGGLTCLDQKCCFTTGSVACEISSECCDPKAVCKGTPLLKECVLP